MSIKEGTTPIDPVQRAAQEEREKKAEVAREKAKEQHAKDHGEELGFWAERIRTFREGWGLDSVTPDGQNRKQRYRGTGDKAFLGEEEQKALFKKEKDQLAAKLKEITSNKQNLLIREALEYLKFYNNEHKSSHGINKYSSLIGGNAGGSEKVRAKLLSIPGMETFVALDNAKLSSLVPQTRLFKVFTNENGDESQVELMFDDHQSILADRNMRGSGAGIKSISIDMNGNNIATAERQFMVKMKLFFSSLDEIFAKRTSPSGLAYEYSDLLKMPDTGSGRDINSATGISKKEFSKRVKMEYGFAVPNNSTLSWTPAEKEVIRLSRRVIQLGLYKHSIDFRENGSVTLDLEYHGFVERKAMKIDVFDLGLTKGERTELEEIRKKITTKSQNSAKKSPKSKSEAERDKEKDEAKALADAAAGVRTKGYQSLLEKVLKNKMMYSVRLQAYKETSGIPVLLKGTVKGSLLDTTKVKEGKVIVPGKMTGDTIGEEQRVDFFYLGDLLDEVIGLAKEEPALKNFEFAFGSFMFKMSDDSETVEIPIASIPISNDAFAKWFKEDVIKKGERTTYNLLDFLMDILNNLAKPSFSPTALQTVDRTRKPRFKKVFPQPQFRSQTFAVKKRLPMGEVQALANGVLKSENLNVGIDKTGTVDYFYIYGVNYTVEKGFFGNPTEDAQNGVYWLVAGAEKGIVKRINYSKSDSKHLNAARVVSNGFSKKGRVLWSLYNANIEMYGNPIFKPGMQVYITSNSFSQQNADELGLGGYFDVIKVSNTIEDGKFKTELETRWSRPTRGDK